ncbi:MAG: hypothetical protein RIE56_14220, partial [Amphiplicatus sp.]
RALSSHEIDTDEIPKTVSGFVSRFGAAELKKLLEKRATQVSELSVQAEFKQTEYWRETLLYNWWTQRWARGNKIKVDWTDHRSTSLAQFCYGYNHIFDQLTERGRNQLKGRLRDSLQNSTLDPLSFEIETAIHLEQRGFRVFFKDLESEATYDLLAADSNASYEIECKYLRRDTGSKIKGLPFAQLCDRVRPVLLGALKHAQHSLMVKLTLATSLPRTEADQATILARIKTAIEVGKTIEHSTFNVGVSQFDGSEALRISTADGEDSNYFLRDHLRNELGIYGAPFIVVRFQKKFAVLAVSSTTEKSIFEPVYKDLKHASDKQFSGSKPSVIITAMGAYTKADFVELHKYSRRGLPTLLEHVGERLLRAQERDHVHGVVFCSTEYCEQHETFAPMFNAALTSYSSSREMFAMRNLKAAGSRATMLRLFGSAKARKAQYFAHSP